MDILKLDRCALSIGAACALLAGCGGSQLPAGTSPGTGASFARKHRATFQYTGAEQTFRVPSGVTRLRVVAVGGNGGGTPFAYGGRVSAVIPVTPSETLAVYVGGAGTSSEPGFNGGGPGGPTGYSNENGNGGGGASDVREGGNSLKDRVVVAGGAGGSGTYDPSHRFGLGGKGGARTGGSGKSGVDGSTPNGRKAGLEGHGGAGGTQHQGGPGGAGYESSGSSGVLGSGGGGGSGCVASSGSCYAAGSGGGGGGGFYGGGGGGGGIFAGCCGSGGGGGGGGGSSYVERTGSNIQMWQGWEHDQGGMVVFFWR